jgi:hypothetical protein
MQDWTQGVEHTSADALTAKDKCENLLLLVEQMKAEISENKEAAKWVYDSLEFAPLVFKLESVLKKDIEKLKQEFILLSAGENVG